MPNSTLIVSEIAIDPNDTTRVTNFGGGLLANQTYLANANGTINSDTFNATTDISSATQQLMTAKQRGVNGDFWGGNDTVIGSAYGDTFNLGAGVNYLDAGTNLGTMGRVGNAQDTLQVRVTSKAVADAIQFTPLTGTLSDATDRAAAAAGYQYKLSTGLGGETDYIKGVEQIDIWISNDINDINGVGPSTYDRSIRLTVSVSEILLDSTDSTHVSSLYGGGLLTDQSFLAWANGTPFSHSFNATTDISSATQQLMATNQRGVQVTMTEGNETVLGSDYGDFFILGAGTNYLDGGTNLGTYPHGGSAQDVLDVVVTSQAIAGAVQVTSLAGILSDATDRAAALAGYTHKVSTGNGETDYIKGIEELGIRIWIDKNGDGITNYASSTDPANEVTFDRRIQLALTVREIQLNPTDPTHVSSFNGGGLLADQMLFASVTGTPFNDTFNAATDISQATKDLMVANQRGVFVDLGAGNDTVVGSAYGDQFTLGAGINYLDGGTNLGTYPQGGNAQDTLQITVTSQAIANAIQLTILEANAANPTDQAAYQSGYIHKLSTGVGETDYLKNVENISVVIWDDKNGDGRINLAAFSDPSNEFSFGRSFLLAPTVREIQLDSTDPTHVSSSYGGGLLVNQQYFAWADGTPYNDSFNAATDISQNTKNLMAASQRGVSVNLGAGNDTVVGSPYADTIFGGLGNDDIDGAGGTDTVIYNDAGNYTTARVYGGYTVTHKSAVDGSVGVDKLSNIEIVQFWAVPINLINDTPPTGLVEIKGTTKQGQILTASTSTLADADGLGALSYQWKANGTAISGATSSSYTLTQAESGKSMSLVASYTDGAGIVESVTSLATAAVTATATPVCFAKGTLIQTIHGKVRIESLTIGDKIVSADGMATEVKWIGHQTIHPTLASLNDVMPIRISANALSENIPRRNLFVSPNHAMLIEGHLIHARTLINGSSIVQMTDWNGDVEYFHIETEHHEIIFAEGAPAETYIDNVSREQFDNFSEYEALYPNAPMMQELNLPRIKFSRQLPSQIITHLEQRAEILAGERALMHA